MNRKRSNAARILALVLAALLVFGMVASAVIIALGEEEVGLSAQYAIRADMLPAEQAIRCEQTVVVGNGTGEKLSQLFFFVYANALRRAETVPAEDDAFPAMYPDGYAPGGLQLLEVLVDGEAADWGVQGEAEAFLRVDAELLPGESVELLLRYYLLLPVYSGAFGAGSFDWRLTGAFPTLCVWREGGFRMNEPIAAGEYAWSEAADWSLELRAPAGWEVAASGGASPEEEEDAAVLWTASIANARDMAVTIGRRYTVWRRGRIAVYCNDRSAAEAALDAAEQALSLYEDWFGEYPWAELDLVMSQILPDAKGAPGLAILPRELFGAGKRRELEFEIYRAVAAQWFGGIAGNDPLNEPWLSEATSAFAALLACRTVYGQERFLGELNARVRPSLQLTVPGGVTPGSAASYFNSRSELELVVRWRGAAVLYELWEAMGEEAFLSAMRAYVAQNRFALCGTREFVAALEADGSSRGALLADLLATIGEYALQQLDTYE